MSRPRLSTALLYVSLPLAGMGAGRGLAHWFYRDRVPLTGISAQSKIQTVHAAESSERSRLAGYLQRIGAAGDLVSLRSLWAELDAGMKGHPLQQLIRQQVIARMVAVDAAGCWAWVVRQKDFPSWEYLAAWGRQDREAAAAAVLAGPKELQGSLQFIARAWAESDPVGFLREGVPASWGISGSIVEDHLHPAALAALSERDLSGALGMAANRLKPGTYTSDDVLKKFASRMAMERGKAGAVDWARSLQGWPDSQRVRLQSYVLSELALEDPVQAAAQYLKIANYQNKDVGGRIAGLLARRDPVAAANWALQLRGDNAESATALVKVVEQIGPNASELLRVAAGIHSESLAARAFQPYQFMEGLSGLSRQELAKLTADMVAQPASPRQAGLVAAGISCWAQKDSAAAWQAVQTLPPDMAAAARAALCRAISEGRMQDFPVTGMLGLVDQISADLPDGSPFAGRYISGVWRRIAGADPAAALMAMRAIPEPDPGVLHSVFASLANDSPAVAVAEWATLPELHQEHAAGGVVLSWADYDPMAASVWVRELPSGKVRDAAAVALLEHLHRSEPASALSWAGSLEEESVRQQWLQKTLKNWPDPAAASQTVESSPLPDEVKNMCREILTTLRP